MQLRIIFFIAYMATLVTACTEKPAPMTEAKLQQVLQDVYIAEVATRFNDSLMQLNKTVDTAALAAAYARIYQHHNISGADLKAALDYYKAHPVQMDSIYKRIMDKFGDWRVQKVKAVDTNALDSLKNSLRPELINRNKQQ